MYVYVFLAAALLTKSLPLVHSILISEVHHRWAYTSLTGLVYTCVSHLALYNISRSITYVHHYNKHAVQQEDTHINKDSQCINMIMYATASSHLVGQQVCVEKPIVVLLRK